MYAGNNEIIGIHYGDKEITGVYLGEDNIWTSFTPFYVIENGVLVQGNYTTAERNYSNGYGHSPTNYGYYGINCTVYADITFETRGAKSLTIKANNGGYSQSNPLLTVTGDGIELVNTYTTNYNAVIDISGYKNVNVRYYEGDNTGFSCVTITELYCGD